MAATSTMNGYLLGRMVTRSAAVNAEEPAGLAIDEARLDWVRYQQWDATPTPALACEPLSVLLPA